MNKTIITLILMPIVAYSFSQGSVDSILVQIEQNNTTLTAHRKQMEARKIGNKIGLMPVNPEIEFNYLWGNPTVLGNRMDFAVTQTFDFPTSYLHKANVAILKNQQVELEYKKLRYEVLLETQLLCSELTFLNALHLEYKKRFQNDIELAKAYKRKLDIGEASLLENNKARINALNSKKKLEQIEMKKAMLLQKLATLNGGSPVFLSDSIFSTETIDTSFNMWYAQAESNNPLLLWLKKDVEFSREFKHLQVANSLPKLSIGYMSEKVEKEQFQGVSVGVTIPLFENKNIVKHANLVTAATESLEADTRLRFYNSMRALHSKIITLQIGIEEYKQEMIAISNFSLLNKALEKGEMSLSEYYYELMFNYQNIETLLEMEKELQDCVIQLKIYSKQ